MDKAQRRGRVFHLRLKQVAMGWTVFLQNSHAGVLTPSTLECDNIWRQDFKEEIKVKWDHMGRP